MKTQTNSIILGLMLVIPSVTFAEGVFDWVDPCKKAEKEFSSNSEYLRNAANSTINYWENMQEPTKELKSYYIDLLRQSAFDIWQQNKTSIELIKIKQQLDENFDSYDFFLHNEYLSKITKKQETDAATELFLVDKNENLLPIFYQQKLELENSISQEKTNLDEECKNDVANQIFRATIGNAALIIDRNFEASKNEKGDLAALIRAVSGISITDITKKGVLGGDKSEARQLLNTFAGGKNSEIRKGLRKLDPTTWKLGIKIKSNNGNPPNIRIGKVCVPWC